MSKIGQLLDHLRVYGNQKETEAADLMNVTLSTWKKWVSGKEKISDAQLKIYLAFCGFDYENVSVKDILSKIETLEPQRQQQNSA